MTDRSTITVTELQLAIKEFALARNWLRFHNPKNLAAAIIVEAAELLQCFHWREDRACAAEQLDSDLRKRIESELADVLIFALNLANALSVNAAVIVAEKLRENEDRFPPDTESTAD